MIRRLQPLPLCAIAMLIVVAPCRAQPPDIGPRIGVGEIDERRSTEGGDSRFRLDLRLFDRPPGTQRVHAHITRAMDDRNRDLSGVPEDILPWTDFDENEVAEAEWQGRNPSRGALKIAEMAGVLEAFVPSRDADATLVLSDWRKYLGPFLEAPALAQNGIVLRMFSAKQFAALPREEREASGLEAPDDSLIFLVNDPQRRLVGITFLNEAGRAIRAEDDSNDRGVVLRFNRPLPENARLRLFIATPKATVSVPFVLSNIELP